MAMDKEIPDEKSRLLNGNKKLRDGHLENGHEESKSVVDRSKGRTDQNNGENETHSWLLPFFVNIFFACTSFSIVMPVLAPYLLQVGAPLSFLPSVVSIYSIGEMIGSVLIGAFYEYATKHFRTLGMGPRVSFNLCMLLGILGSAMFAVAGWVKDQAIARYLILWSRFIQGLWTGGEQAIEQAYLSAAVHPSKRVEYTATLSTCAVLGFVTGPSIGAALSQIDTSVFGYPINANNAPGVFTFFATVTMFFQTYFFFDGKDDRTCITLQKDCKQADGVFKGIQKSAEDGQDPVQRPFNHIGVAVSIIIFFIHYYSFAVQETITTPMVIELYNWSPLKVNLLFAGSGVLSLIASFLVRYITRFVDDRAMLIASILIGLIGSVFLIDMPFNRVLPMWRFLIGFSLVTIAFPVGRNVVIGVFGNVLGPVNQGRWMGIMVGVSAIPRIIGPYFALEALQVVDWQTWLEFGICAVLFGVSFAGALQTIQVLVPYTDFVKRQGTESNHVYSSHSPIPSPIPSPISKKRLFKNRLINSKNVSAV